MATAAREGHDSLGASAVLYDPLGKEVQRMRLESLGPGLDRWGGMPTPGEPGRWSFTIEAWDDPYGTWQHNAEIEVSAGIDIEPMLAEGVHLFRRAAEEGGRTASERDEFLAAAKILEDTGHPPQERLAAWQSAGIPTAIAGQPIR
ncbi:hypothetical protein BIU82_06590 [Arthrobacter sp. SW1]|nr:hypothetical protein BIU82_06590 [Arthrobacter sp. SW1]